MCYAGSEPLVLIDRDTRVEVSIDELRSQADTEFTMFAPFRHREVRIKGILLEDLLSRYLSKVPERIRFTALDDYQITFDNWKKNQWVVVTHEDGKPLSVRQQGPLRVVEMDLNGKNVNNLREFNDWIWMLAKIEILP
ncbi:hypothetical protein L3Q72_01750 [Vibrio sp. JC009]|uniref:hypothetical protein n=1 Tax=Vibrio sp. JC009 TaxID=2912314 RepID=UPI0023AFB06E|nr:hypothetical protein [Vibrio sp. JC009]WED22170.1 hypothetical protein L3Q72_01750 [Vibrio sp. JC009]